MPYVSGGSGGSGAGREIGYDQITGAVTVTSTTEATPTTIITCAAHTFPGTPVLLQVFIPNIQMQTGSGDNLIFTLFESTTELGRLGIFTNPATVNTENLATTMQFRFTPTGAAHTYLICAHKTGGTMAVGSGAGGTGTLVPAFARFTVV